MKLSRFHARCVVAASTMAVLAILQPAIADIPPAGGATSSGVVNQLVMQAQKALKDGNIPLAVISFKNASSAAPRNGTVRAQLGIVLLQSGDTYSAERELRQARKDGAADQVVLPALFQAMLLRHEEKAILDEFSDFAAQTNSAAAADIYKARAVALQSLGQLSEAAAAMDKSLKVRRDEPGLLTRARLAQEQHDIPKAMALTDEAIKIAPQNVNPVLFKFGLLMAAKDLNGAQKVSDDLVARFPNNIPARFSRVDVLMQTGQSAKAAAEINAALAKTPGLAIGIYYRAVLQTKSGDFKGAWRNAQSLPQSFVQSQPSTAIAISQMAVAAGATDTAAAILAGTVAKFSDDVNLRTRLAALRLQQNNVEGALSALEPVKDKLAPAGAQILARLYVRANKPNDALSLLQKIEQSGQGTDSITMDIVGIENRQGQSEAAMNDLARAVAQKPSDPVLAAQLVSAFLRVGRSAEALAAADKLGADPKQKTLSLALRAQVLLAQQKLDAALSAYNMAVQLDSHDVVSLYGRAGVLALLQRYDDAKKDLNAILAADPKNVSAYLKLAEIAASQNQDQVVRGTLAKAMAQVPGNSAPRAALVRYLLVRKDAQGALAAANELARQQPKDIQALVLLGQAQVSSGQKAEAVATFKRLVAVSPKGPTTQILLANAIQLTGDKAGANAAMKAAVDLDPNSANTRIAQINLLLTQGDKDGAVAAARAFRAANPTNTADVMLGDTLAKTGHSDQAKVVYQQSFATRPNDTTLMRIVAMTAASGDTNGALDALSKWLDKNAGDTAVRVEYATLLMRVGDKAKAAAQYEIVLQQDPNNVIGLNNLGWLKQSTDLPRAITLVTQAAKLSPGAPNIIDTLGWLKLQQKQASEALTLLKRAHDLSPKDGSITYHLVLALDATGSHDAARGLLKALMASNAKFEDRDAAAQLANKWH